MQRAAISFFTICFNGSWYDTGGSVAGILTRTSSWLTDEPQLLHRHTKAALAPVPRLANPFVRPGLLHRQVMLQGRD